MNSNTKNSHDRYGSKTQKHSISAIIASLGPTHIVHFDRVLRDRCLTFVDFCSSCSHRRVQDKTEKTEMGQSGSKVSVHVHLDSGYYYAGDVVTGAVVLHVEQPLDVKSISVKVLMWMIRA